MACLTAGMIGCGGGPTLFFPTRCFAAAELEETYLVLSGSEIADYKSSAVTTKLRSRPDKMPFTNWEHSESMAKGSIRAADMMSRCQVAALPLRERDGRVEVCLVTTRTTRRWTVPKGWPMKGLRDREAARIEAEEEAGIIGKPGKKPLGSFVYWKRLADHFELVKVDVYPLRVTGTLPAWKEETQRDIMWMSLSDASIMVDEPGLATLLLRAQSGV